MASTNKTALGLVQYGLDDIPDQADTNEDNRIITEEFQKRPAADSDGKYANAIHSDTAGTADYAKDAAGGSTLDTRIKAAQTQADKYTQASQAKVNALSAAAPGASGGLALYSQGIVTYTHVKTGTVHALTGPAGAKHLTFMATASFTDGETFTVNGTAATAKTIDGAMLHTGDFVSGQVVSAALEGSVLTFQFRSYYAALQTKANEDDYTYYKLSGGNFAESGSDLDTFPVGIIWAFSGAESSTLLHRPPNASATAAEIITESGNGYTGGSAIIQTWKQRAPVKTFMRTGSNGNWTDWVEYATATPPEEHTLPYSAGVTDAGEWDTSKYWRNQFGEVRIALSAKAPTVALSNGYILATLPVGYRPSYVPTAPCIVKLSDGTKLVASLSINTRGEVRIWGGTYTAMINEMSGQVSFVAR